MLTSSLEVESSSDGWPIHQHLAGDTSAAGNPYSRKPDSHEPRLPPAGRVVRRRPPHRAMVNCEPAALFTSNGVGIQTRPLCMDGGVRAISMTINPDKLSRRSVAEVE